MGMRKADFKISTLDKILDAMQTERKYSRLDIARRSKITYPCLIRIMPELVRLGLVKKHPTDSNHRHSKSLYSRPAKTDEKYAP